MTEAIPSTATGATQGDDENDRQDRIRQLAGCLFEEADSAQHPNVAGQLTEATAIDRAGLGGR